jgi:hypothetical protein
MVDRLARVYASGYIWNVISQMGILPLLPTLCQTAASGALVRYHETLHFVPDPPSEGLVMRLGTEHLCQG